MVRELSPELAKIAKEELNENPKQTAGDINSLKEWISKQPHLRARTDDQWLLAILRGCKFSLEKVKLKLDLFYTFRSTIPDVTLRMKPADPEFLAFLKLGTCLLIPQSKTTLHPAIILLRPGMYDPEKNHIADVVCALYYLVQILVIENDVATVLGTKVLVDYQGVSLNHLPQATPSMIKKLVAVSQDSLPLRLKGSHHLNVPTGIDIVFKIVSGFLNEKSKQRLKMHKSFEEVFEFLPKEVIPPEYGGSGKNISELIEYCCCKVEEYKSWMQEEVRFGTDENKRMDNATGGETSDHGSFRTLVID